MSRLLIHVEGETEETFVNDILRPHLYGKGYTNVSARLLGNARLRYRRGGIKAWSAVRSDIIRHLKEDPAGLTTMMVDYYALPQSGGKAWPGREAAGNLPFDQKAATIESALLEDICQEMGDAFNPNRFIPYVMMHEFEALLFSDCQRFGQGIGQPDLAQHLHAIRAQFPTPEHINDSPITAPSKRILDLVPGYNKPFHGNLAVLAIGLDPIRNECPHFSEWLSRLDAWPQ